MSFNHFHRRISLSALAAAMAATPQVASAQTFLPPQIPIADVQCNGSGFQPLSSCIVTGNRTHSTPVVTVAPFPRSPTLSLVTHTEQVTYDGRLVIGGSVLSTNRDFFYGFPPQALFPAEAAQIEGSLAYTGTIYGVIPRNSNFPITSIMSAPQGQFSNYDITNLDVRKIGVELRNQRVEIEDRVEYTFSLASVDPSAVTNNSTALQGNYHGNDKDSGALVFGKINGSATVIAAQPNSVIVTESDFARNQDGSPSSIFLSPLALQYDVTSQETTRLDENGLVTPAIAVTDGIEMNGSRITHLGNAVNAGDAVNLGQVTQLIATSGPIKTAQGSGALAGGKDSSASGRGAVALGEGQQATGNGAVAIGDPNIATGTGAVAIGANNTASARSAVALGEGNTASGQGAVALGMHNSATAAGTVAVGAFSTASTFGNVAVGFNAEASGIAGAAVGTRSVASASGTTALGTATSATASGATAVGYRAQAEAAGSTAVGIAATASGAGSSALGRNAIATAAESIALGSGSVADEANTVSVGNATAKRRVVNVAAAVADTDAVNKAQLNSEANARAAADNRLQTQLNAMGASLFSLTGRVTSLENTVRQDRKDARQGIAAAVAMTAAPMPSAPGKVAYTVNVANFRDEQAVAASFAMRLRGPDTMAVTAGVAYGGSDNTAVRVGLAGEF